MGTMTICEAEHILDIVSAALQDTSHRHHPVSALEGYDIHEICNAIKLQIANEFLRLEHRVDFDKLFAGGLELYDSIPWTVMATFVADHEVDEPLAEGVFNPIDPSTMAFKDDRLASLETATSFGDYCKKLGSKDPNYWQKIYSRIGLDYTSTSPRANHPVIKAYDGDDKQDIVSGNGLAAVEGQEYETPDAPIHKWVLGIFSGYFVGSFALLAIARGLETYLNPNGDQAWGLFYWHKHFLWRALASTLATAAGASIASLAVRKRGELAGALVGLPSTLGWSIVAYLSITNQTNSERIQGLLIQGYDPSLSAHPGNRIIAVVLAIGAVVLGYLIGSACTPLPSYLADQFDSRRGCIFGVRWYHIFWLPIVAYASLMTAAYGGAYVIQFVIASWSSDGIGIGSVLLTMLIIAWGWTVHLCYTGLKRTYHLLSGLEPHTEGHTSLSVLKFGCGFPLLAVIAQGLIGLIQYGIAKVFE